MNKTAKWKKWNKLRDGFGIGASLVPYIPGESSSVRHRRRAEHAVQFASHLLTWAEFRGISVKMTGSITQHVHAVRFLFRRRFYGNGQRAKGAIVAYWNPGVAQAWRLVFFDRRPSIKDFAKIFDYQQFITWFEGWFAEQERLIAMTEEVKS